jgi:aminomethyltransferase
MVEVPHTTPLTDWHAAHDGRLVDFAGWRMPIHYGSIVDEHMATRSAAGLFDVSHMGRLAVIGPDAVGWLDRQLTRRVTDLAEGHVRYTLVTSDHGDRGLSVLDDALVTREAASVDGSPRLTLVVNAGNRPRVIEWLRGRLPAEGVTLQDLTHDTAMIAVQGPRAVGLVAGLATSEAGPHIRGLGNYRAMAAAVANRPALVSRTGYTGEDGVELVVSATDAVQVWEAIRAAGAGIGLRCCGLGARDTLRLEAAMPLYGHELVADSDPFAIGLSMAVNLVGTDGQPRHFPGVERLREMRSDRPHRVRVGLAFDSRRPAREGSLILGRSDAREVGVVTSGSFAPWLGHAVALASIDRVVAEAGEPLDAVVRDTRLAARIVPLPFYRRGDPATASCHDG